MLAAAEQSADTELPDCCLQRIAKRRQPSQPAAVRQDVGLLGDLAKRAQVTDQVRRGRAAGDNRQSQQSPPSHCDFPPVILGPFLAGDGAQIEQGNLVDGRPFLGFFDERRAGEIGGEDVEGVVVGIGI